MSNHGKIWWSELMTRDVDAAKTYYADLCGWRFDEMPDPDTGSVYYVAMQGDQPVAGLMDLGLLTHLDGVPSHWFTYLAVDDVDAASEATTKAGGQIMRPAFDVPGIGRIAIIQDPSGAPVGIMTPAPPSEDC
ncbi:MAG: VOC family protein [Pelagimonas sp.]|nr:VOC family protein [Pelagimonas sp.]